MPTRKNPNGVVPTKRAQFEEFQAAVSKGGETLGQICTRLHIHVGTGSAWMHRIRLDMRQALRIAGLNEHAIAQGFVRLTRERGSRIRLEAHRELAKMMGGYPSDAAPAAAAVTVIIGDVVNMSEAPPAKQLTVPPESPDA